MNLEAQIRKILRPFRKLFQKNNDFFLRDICGVLHVGANCGQEAKSYAKHNLKVVWFEPIPDVYKQLEFNIREYPMQRAFNCLVADVDGKKFKFHLANNNGESSSVFEMSQHKDVWPEIAFHDCIELESRTVASVLQENGLDFKDFQALVLDVQGAELLVLKGCEPLFDSLRFIRTEVADFESYAGGCQLPDLERFLLANHFHEVSRNIIGRRRGGGFYYDIVYKRDVF
jgi:FkbM family methyltransferase